jgi:S-adenosylmethionine decarboxylase
LVFAFVAIGRMSVSPIANEPGGHFFEGAEKLLEIWFENSANGSSLRKIPREEIVAMLEIARCHILHYRSNTHLDSYVLSESSLFVSEQRIILKTCGTTRLLESIPRLLELAKHYAGMDSVVNVYYTRKNFLRPQLQPYPHKTFDDEVDYLDQFFPDGEAYCMGSLKQERWYMYTLNRPELPPSTADHTLEILMTDIPKEIRDIYSMEKCADGKECTAKAGIAKVIPPGAIIHEEMFEPVGYSMNALIPNTDQYVTIHVTPESDFCYASFETNQRRQCLYKQTLKVIECFQPEKFMMTIFANAVSESGNETQIRLWNDEIPGYRRVNLQFVRLQVSIVFV